MKTFLAGLVFTGMFVGVVIASLVEFVAWSVQRVFAAVGLG